MAKSFIPTAMLVLLSGTAHARGSAELAEIRQQLQSLMQRMDRLEQENSSLKEENEQLKLQTDYLRAETRGLRKDSAVNSAEAGKVKGADWASRVSLKGDLRYRHEQTSDDTVNAAGVRTADRYRDRIRARVNVEAKATDSINLGIGLTTTEGNDPRSGNQSLTNAFSRKAIDLDLAYFNWRFASWGDLIGGKMKQPFFKQSQSAIWDNDVNPEGLALNFKRGLWFGTVYNYWVNEVSGPQNASTADALLAGAQVGTRLPLGESSLVLAAHYYDLSAGEGRVPFFNGSSNGNSTINVDNVAVLAHDFEVINLTGEFTTRIASLPLLLWADLAQNQAADDFDTAWGAGVLLGKASDYRTWELSVTYHSIEKDALFAQLIESDFGGGFSDTEGWTLRAGYAPLRNWTLNAAYLINQRNVDVANSAGQTDIDYNRLQLDFNVKF